MEKVRERLIKATAALEGAGVLYAVTGGNAVAAWVSSVDEAAVRNTRDVDVMLRRVDLEKAKAALEGAGFVHRIVAGIDVFLDNADAKVRDAVHVVFANEFVREGELAPNPDVTDAEFAQSMRVLSLESLVRVKLTAWRDKDRTHIRDLIEVGLVDRAWVSRLPPGLGERLGRLLDDPNG